jgi:pimeloyl-ACP methyl ester carboxylesterase
MSSDLVNNGSTTDDEPVNLTDEFELLRENAQELGHRAPLPPRRRLSTQVNPGQNVSSISWGADPSPMVFLHGGGQNAHTWDTVLLALGEDALAIDLPGHGHSDWRADHDYGARANAQAIAAVMRSHAATPVPLVGMSLGGLTAISLVSQFPDLVSALMLVDVSPQAPQRSVDLTAAQRGSVALISGPETYESFDAMLDATVAASPNRSRASLRRGVLHNAKEMADGSWRWRYDRQRKANYAFDDPTPAWDEFAAGGIPVTLVRGARSSFVHDADVAEMARLQPRLQVQVVADSGHSVQSDQPLALVKILRDFLAAPGDSGS